MAELRSDLSELVDRLQRDAIDGCLVGDPRTKRISKDHYAQVTGLSVHLLYFNDEIFREIERGYTGAYLLVVSRTKREIELFHVDRLRQILEADASSGTLVEGRLGKLNRRHYASVVGLGNPTSQRWNSTLEEFDRAYAEQISPLRHVEHVRSLLEAKLADGEIELHVGKINREAFLTPLGIPSHGPGRFPAVADLLDQFDLRIQQIGYIPKAIVNEQLSVKSALTSIPPIVRKGLRVNIAELSKVTGVTKDRLKSSYFLPIISDYEISLNKEIEDDPCICFVNDCICDFKSLTLVWSSKFVERLVRAFHDANAPTKNKLGDKYRSLMSFMEWIGQRRCPDRETLVEQAETKCRISDDAAWSRILREYRSYQVAQAGAENKSAANRRIAVLRAVLRGIEPFGVVPETTLKGVKHSRFTQRHLPTLIEPGPGSSALSYIDFARRIFADTCAKLRLDLDNGEAKRFFDFLTLQVGTPPKGADTAHVVSESLNMMLATLTRQATLVIRDSMADYQQGQILLSTAIIPTRDFVDRYFSEKTPNNERYLLRQKFFPVTNGALAKVGIANLLRLIVEVFSGICPATGDPVYGGFFAKRYRECGGLAKLERMLGPDCETVGAVVALYQCKSGINTEVARTIDVDCISDSNIDGYKRILATKSRARGKPIVYEFPSDDFVIEAIEWLQVAGRLYRQGAGEHSDRLCVSRLQGSARLITQTRYTTFFKEFANKSFDGPSNRGLIPAMIRPSVLLALSLSNDGRLLTGMAMGQHSQKTTGAYQNRWPTRVLYDRAIRRFQNEIEVIVLTAIPDVAAKMGLGEEELQSRLDLVSPTGLGTFCLGAGRRPGSQPTACDTLDCWNSCPNLLVIAEASSLSFLVSWQSSLRQVQGDWERDRYERWERFWLPWLCLADVVEEKMSVDARLLPIWQEAKRISQARLKDPDFSPPRPW